VFPFKRGREDRPLIFAGEGDPFRTNRGSYLPVRRKTRRPGLSPTAFASGSLLTNGPLPTLGRIPTCNGQGLHPPEFRISTTGAGLGAIRRVSIGPLSATSVSMNDQTGPALRSVSYLR